MSGLVETGYFETQNHRRILKIRTRQGVPVNVREIKVTNKTNMIVQSNKVAQVKKERVEVVRVRVGGMYTVHMMIVSRYVIDTEINSRFSGDGMIDDWRDSLTATRTPPPRDFLSLQ